MTSRQKDCFGQGKHAKNETKVDKRHVLEFVVEYFKATPTHSEEKEVSPSSLGRHFITKHMFFSLLPLFLLQNQWNFGRLR